MLNRVAAFLLGGSSVLALLAVSMHPVVKAHTPGDMLKGAVALGPMDRAVHATLMVIIFAMLFALATYTIGRLRAAGVAALIAYASGCCAILFATAIDGFFVPAYAKIFIAAGPSQQAAAIAVLAAGAVGIQIATKFGLITMGAATLLWSLDLIPERAPQQRGTGVFGLLAGIVILAVTLTTARFNPHSLMVVIAVQAFWYVAIAGLLYRSSAGADATLPQGAADRNKGLAAP